MFDTVLSPIDMSLLQSYKLLCIVGSMKLGAIYSLNIEAIIQNADECELCKVWKIIVIYYTIILASKISQIFAVLTAL